MGSIKEMKKNEGDLLKRNAAVTTIRDKTGFCDVHGYLLDISDDWILVENISEFHLDGYSIVRKSDVKEIRYDKRDKYFEKILKLEGIKKNVSKKYDIDISDLHSIFNSLKKIKLNIIVECEEEGEEVFIIGKISQMGKNFVSMSYFDSCGKWNRQKYRIDYSKITIIRFDEEYINVFSKYVKEDQME